MTAVYGGAEVGSALVGSDSTRSSSRAASRRAGPSWRTWARGIPAVAERASGFDPAIILPDAPRRSDGPGADLGGVRGRGQTCVAVKRVYVVGDAGPWAEALAGKARGAPRGRPGERPDDLGPMISAAARDRFHPTIKAAVGRGARPGRRDDRPGRVVLSADGPPGRDGGGRDRAGRCVRPGRARPGRPGRERGRRGRQRQAPSARGERLGPRRRPRGAGTPAGGGDGRGERGRHPSAHAAAPFGGCKASGFGRTRGTLGLREFTCPR